MKKALIVFLMAGVLAAGAFAQGVELRGSAYMGIRLQGGYGEGNDARFGVFHVEDGFTRPPRFDLSATAARANYGLTLDTRFLLPTNPETGHPDAQFVLHGLFGWVDFGGFAGNDSFRLTMGQISSPIWVTALHASLPEHKFDEIRGFRLEYNTPIPGLSVGAAFRTNRPTPAGEMLPMSFGRFFQQSILGATFTPPPGGIPVRAVLAWDFSSNTQALLGVDFTGIPDLTAGIQLMATRLASFGDPPAVEGGFPGSLTMDQLVGYRVMRPLNVYMIFGQTIHGASGVDPELRFTPGVEFRITNDLSSSLSLMIESTDLFDTTNMTLSAGIEYTLRGPAVLYLEYKLQLFDMGSPLHTIGFGITVRAF